MINLEMN
jgi:hypothetical protein